MNFSKKIPVKKSWGQHFLNSEDTARQIVDFSPALAGETVLEIGPGRGALTRILSNRGFRLVLVERDPLLAARWKNAEGIELISGDILQTGSAVLQERGPLHIVGNLPYNIATPILFLLWHHTEYVRSAVITVQKEVGERLVSSSGCRNYSSLSVIAQAMWQWEKCLLLKPSDFTPPPRVDSLVLRGIPKTDGPDKKILEKLEAITRALFHQRRKKISNTLPNLLDGNREAMQELLATTGTSSDIRPDKLEVATFLAWAETLSKQ